MIIEKCSMLKDSKSFFKIPNDIISCNILYNYILPSYLFLSIRRNLIGITEFYLKDLNDTFINNKDPRYKKYQEFYNSLFLLNSMIINKTKTLSIPSFNFSCFPEIDTFKNKEFSIISKDEILNSTFEPVLDKNCLNEKIIGYSLLTKEDLKYDFTILTYKEYYNIFYKINEMKINSISFLNFYVYIKKEISKNKLTVDDINLSKLSKKINISVPSLNKYKKIFREIELETFYE